MTEKEKVIEQIIGLMKEHQISTTELFNSIPHTVRSAYDLLCVVDGAPKRVCFSEGKELNPIGIFLNKSNVYFMLCEMKDKLRIDAKECCLPSLALWERVYCLRDKINKRLITLGYPPFSGEYFAENCKDKGTNWVISMDGAPNKIMECHIHNAKKQAKIRYFGIFR